MFNRQIKYPGLSAGAKANGIDYRTALARVRKGMSVADACSKPVHSIYHPRSRKGIPKAPRNKNGNAPGHINTLRTAYCDQFMKTGALDPEIAVKLRKYADECKAAKRNSRRVSTEHEVESHRAAQQDQRTLGCWRASRDGDDGDRDDHQTLGI